MIPRADSIFVQDAPQFADVDVLHNLLLVHIGLQFGETHAAKRQFQYRRQFTGDGFDRGQLRRGKNGRASRARRIVQVKVMQGPFLASLFEHRVGMGANLSTEFRSGNFRFGRMDQDYLGALDLGVGRLAATRKLLYFVELFGCKGRLVEG